MKAAVGVAICQGLDEVGATLLYSGARAINTGVGAKAGALMIGAGALSYYLQQTGCTWPEEGINTNQPPIPGCWGGTGGFVQVWQNQPFVEPGYQTSVTVNMQQFLGWITPFDFELHASGEYSTAYAQYDYIQEDGQQIRAEGIIRGDKNLRPYPMFMKSFPGEGEEFICTTEETPNEPVLMPSQNIDYGDCIYTVNHLGWGLNTDSDLLYSVHEVLPGGSSGVRSSGGRMGACFFEPTMIVIGGDGGGGDGVPIPPAPIDGDDGEPWWLPLARQAAATAAGNLIAGAIRELLTQPYEGVQYEMPAPCDVDAEGNQLVWTGQIPEQKFEPAVLDRLDALSNQMAQHLAWKTPICKPDKPELLGTWVTTRWISDEKMAHSGVRLRKLFRYRSQSSRDLGQLSSYWKDFTWNAGAVCVFHQGAWWGTPQVWAASEAEGQRVIRFAAAEAGLDPDQTGRWGVSSSRTPRYGMSGTMKILKYKGFPWVASRDGAAWPNTLALQIDP